MSREWNIYLKDHNAKFFLFCFSFSFLVMFLLHGLNVKLLFQLALIAFELLFCKMWKKEKILVAKSVLEAGCEVCIWFLWLSAIVQIAWLFSNIDSSLFLSVAWDMKEVIVGLFHSCCYVQLLFRKNCRDCQLNPKLIWQLEIILKQCWTFFMFIYSGFHTNLFLSYIYIPSFLDNFCYLKAILENTD